MKKNALGLLNSAVYVDLLIVSKVCVEQAKDPARRKLPDGLISGVRNPMALENWPDGEDPNAFYFNDTEAGRIDRRFEDLLVADIDGAPLSDFGYACSTSSDSDNELEEDVNTHLEGSDTRESKSFVRCPPKTFRERDKKGNLWIVKRWPEGNGCAKKVVGRN